MFADIAGSTRLYETLGDAKARDVTSKCIQLLTDVTEKFGGRVIKTIGDEVMCTFPTADEAADAAIRMQEQVEANASSWETQLHIRVGFHYGEVIEEGGDVFGDAVNLAARMAAQSKADQIIITGETLEEMSPRFKPNTRLIITTRVKGKQIPVEIYELTWGDEEELTIMGAMPMGEMMPQPPSATLKLTFQDQTVDVREDSPPVTLGRGRQNTLMVAHTMASRLHSVIECRGGKFVLVDKSTNGTFVMSNQGKMTFVHRDEHLLEGDGVIGLGQKMVPSEPMAVKYSNRGPQTKS
jgi:hypothetical protein